MSCTSNYLIILFICFGPLAFAQVGIGNTDPKASLDISTSNITSPNNTDGILIPKMNNFPAINPTANQDGMMVFITGNGVPSKGFYYWNNSSTNWVSIKGIEKINDLTDGKSDNDGTQNGSSIFLGIGAGSNDDLTDNKNVGIGYSAISSNTLGSGNTAIGYNSLSSNTISSYNVAIGYQTLHNSTSGENVAIGKQSLFSNISGYRNIAIGSDPLYDNTTGFDNIGIGYQVLYNNTTGNYNIARGYRSLYGNTIGWHNNASNSEALYNNTSGGHNIANGYQSLYTNVTGSNNIALGYHSLYFNSGGQSNIGIGRGTLIANANGSSNIAIGQEALNNSSGSDNIAIGRQAGYFGASGSGNVYIGEQSGYHHVGDNTLWIENSSANEDSALVYGEFNNNILRTNSEFQIGNPAGTGYAFPTTDGAANQFLQTDGSGSVLFTSPIVGTTNYLSKFTATTSLGNSIVYDDGTNVGIGTSTPDYKFSVNGIANLNEGITSGVALRVNGTEALWYNGSYFSWGFGGTSNYFADNVGIGENSPSQKLVVKNSNASGFVAQIYNTSANTQADGLKIRIGTPPPGTDNYFIGFYGGNDVLNGRISGNGAVGTIYSTVSDRRLKTNISTISNALGLINKIQPKSYEFKEAIGIKEYGFIAQELQLIYPQAVSGSPGSNVKIDPMMVDYSRLTPLLTSGIKELNTKLKNLEEENKKIKEENEKIKEELTKYKNLEARLAVLEKSIRNH